MSYNKIAMVPADGSKLTKETPRHTDMVSLDGKISIKFKNKKCVLHTQKDTYHLKESYEGTVYYATIKHWYVCYNGIELSWKKYDTPQCGGVR